MNSNNILERKSNLESQFEKTTQTRSEYLGEFWLYKNHSTGKTIVCKEQLKNNQQALMKEIDFIKKEIFNKNEYQVNLLDFSIQVQKTWCSTQYVLKVF